ncbi:PKD domain-containing protein [Myxococcus xanthus]|uniref:PKD domain-containing protein n=1 Tax=Myxococcus xanthus TaxID=34 RepID=A0A7Y4IFR6_MYXXA|nr:PKD domain-containing protein [Myxococcus xanthus]NOJ78246.1 PKD domain-containing protein [Myxococcus xanthus]NOJ89390.1 PKD domain-containing protein [Myxococcus xanthus]
MPLIPRRPGSLVALLLMTVAVGPWASGCRRAVRPDLGQDRTVEAGVPVDLGSQREDATAVTWDFGDGSDAQTAPWVSHAFSRAGAYTVRALHEGEEVGRVQLTVVPRPVLRAVPSSARTVMWLPELRGHVDSLMDFYARLVGPENARRAVESSPLLPLLFTDLENGAGSVVDPDEGFGFFLLPEFDGVVTLLGITEPEAALNAVAGELERAGHGVMPQPDGSATVEPASGGPPMLLFEDRGYLYLAVPEGLEEPDEGEAQQSRVLAIPDAEVARQAVRSLTGPGISEDALLTELRGKVASGSMYLFSGKQPGVAPDEEGTHPIRGFAASLAVKPERVDLDGFLSSSTPLFQGARAPASALLKDAELGPIAAAQISVPPEELARLVFGAPGSERRERMVASWRREGLDVEALLKALRGDVVLRAYFDIPAFFRNFIRNKRPDIKGSIVFEAGLTESEPVRALVQKQLEDSVLRYTTQQEANGTLFRTRIREQPVELRITPERASLLAGELLQGRPRGDVGAELRERFGGEAFSSGHVSVMVDLGRLRADLRAAERVPGVPNMLLGATKALSGALLDRMTPLDSGFLDFSPVEGGGRLKGRLSLRVEQEASR